MAQYNVQDPQGNMRVIEGPDGASDDEVIAQAQKLFGQSGAMPTQDPIKAFKAALANHPARPNPIASFDQDVHQDPQATVPYEQGVWDRANTVMSGLEGGKLLGSLASAGASKIGSLLDLLKAPQTANALAPLESAGEAGNAIGIAKDAETAANTATANKLYAAIPEDIKIPVTTASTQADNIVNSLKDVDASFHPSGKLLDQIEALQNMDKSSIGAIQTMRSSLGDLARNGEGIEKVYAAKLFDALNQDVEAFGQTNILSSPISQGPSLEAMSLRNKWGNLATETSDVDPGLKSSYVRPDVFGQPPTPTTALTNADVPANLSKANSFYKNAIALKNSPMSQAIDKAAVEAKANVIFKSGNASDVLHGQALLGDEGFKAASGQFYNKLLNAKDLPGALQKYTPEFLNTALGPDRVAALQKLAQFQALVSKAKVAAAVGTGAIGVGGAYATYNKLSH